jgi:hypothetical protein
MARKQWRTTALRRIRRADFKKSVTARRFPPPWAVEDIGGSFVAKASNGRPLVFIYYGEGVARRSLAKLLTRDAARRIASGIVKLPGLVQWLSKGTH